MALSKIQSESINLADTFAFTGTVTGTGSVVHKFTKVPIPGKSSSGSAALIPRDNTIPQSDEGIEVISHTYTPAVSSSKIFVTAVFQQQETANVDNRFAAAMFFNGTCVQVRAENSYTDSGLGDFSEFHFMREFDNTDGSNLVIMLRCDGHSSGTIINGQYLAGNAGNFTASGSAFGGTDAVNQTFMTILETT